MDRVAEHLAQQAADLIALDTLPDSRLTTIHTPKNAKWIEGMWWVPIFCAGCGRGGCRVPQEFMTFVCWLCRDCAPKYGHWDGFYAEPDAQFFARVRLAMLEKYGRVLTPAEFEASPLAALFREGR